MIFKTSLHCLLAYCHFIFSQHKELCSTLITPDSIPGSLAQPGPLQLTRLCKKITHTYCFEPSTQTPPNHSLQKRQAPDECFDDGNNAEIEYVDLQPNGLPVGATCDSCYCGCRGLPALCPNPVTYVRYQCPGLRPK